MSLLNKLAVFLTSCAFSVLLVGSGLSHAAGNASFSLSPASATENVGTTFSLGIYENGNGNQVNVVTANLSYNASMLQYIGASCVGDFSAPATSPSGGGGSVSLTCSTPGGATAPSDNEEAAVVSFKALAGSGSTSVSFASGSIIASNGSNVWNGGTAGGNYAFNTPATSTPTNPGSGSGSSTSSSNGAGSSGSKPTSGNPTTKQNGSGSTSNSSTTSSNPSKGSTSSTTKPSTKKTSQHNRNIHGRLVSSTNGLSATTYWVIGIVGAGLIIAALVFRQKLLGTIKAASAKYNLSRHRA